MVIIINSLLQIVLYAPMALFFVNVISGSKEFDLNYAQTAESVAIVGYLCYSPNLVHIISKGVLCSISAFPLQQG